jgi:hypothetical protein
MEGTHCFNPAAGCTDGTLALPAIEYPHSIGCSITGGFRYRGSAMPGFAGTYVFSDYCAGRIWGATTDGHAWRAVDLLDAGFIVSTFGEDEAGELYVARYAEDGGLYRLADGDSAAVRLAVSRVGNGRGVVTSTPARIYCAQICGVDAPAGASFALAVVPDAGSSFLGWSGHEDCADGMVTLASARHCYARLAAPFTDPVIVSGSTPIRAVHVTELRARVDALRVAAGLAEVSWTDPVLVAGSTPVRAAHLRELRDALGEAYDALGQPRPGYSGPDPDTGVIIRASHIVELRSAVTALE